MPKNKTLPRIEKIGTRFSPRQSENPVASRVGGRVKKAKVPFDPSVSLQPKKRLVRSLSVMPTSYYERKQEEKKRNKSHYQDISDLNFKVKQEPKEEKYIKTNESDSVLCMICHKSGLKKGKKILSCKDCTYKAHINCLKIDFQNPGLVEDNWRCYNCKACRVCDETSEAGKLIICCVCVDAYHYCCHEPKIIPKLINKASWECNNCRNSNKFTKKDEISIRNIICATLNNNRDLSKVPPKEERIDPNMASKNIHSEEAIPYTSKNIYDDEVIPDVSLWSCGEVWNYVKKYFPKEANLFKEHEIDGASLLLMKRSDIIRGFSLKLGPAIRIYSLIVKLQTKSLDPSLTWM